MAKDRRQEHIAAMEANAANRPEPRSHFHRPNRKPGDIRTHFHLHTGGYTSEHATTGERGWKLDHNNLQELYLRDAYFEFDPTGHRQYLESFSYDPVAKKDMGYRVVHAHVLGQPADLEIARNYPKEEWRDAGYSVGRAKGMPACFIDRKTGNCLPNDRSVDVLLKNRLNKIPGKDPTVVYRGGRVPTYAADMQYRFNQHARPNTSAAHLSRKEATDLFIWMVLDSTQVKSATGNRGTFDAKDPDIRHNPRRARRNEGAPTLRDLAFQPIPNIPDSKRVTLDFKNGHYLTIAGAPSFPDQGDGEKTWALQVNEGGRSYSLMQQTREQVEAMIARLAALPATDDYLQRHDYPAYQARVKARQAEAEAKRKAAEEAAHKALMTPKFRKWFGKSKVVDEQGRPLKVYHGSQHAGFHAFDTSEQQKPGFFFTDNLAMARSYTSRPADVELPYFRKLKDALAFEETSEFPLTIEKVEGGYDVRFDGSYVGFYGKGETKAMLEDINAQSTRYPGTYEVYLRMEDPLVVDAKGANWSEIPYDDGDGVQYLETNDISRMAQDADYDGVIIRDVSDPGGHGYGTESGDVYIVFKPNQIKSTQNIGAYSLDTDDLRLNPRKPRAARNPRRRRSRG